jgi:hypothetical protein
VRFTFLHAVAVLVAASSGLWIAQANLGCEGESSFVIPPWDAGAVDTRHAAACRAWAQSVCDYEERCPPAISARYTDRAQCLARAELTCEVVAQDPSVNFDEATVAGCTYPIDCAADLPSFMCLPHGTTAERAPCLWGIACATGACSFGIDSNGVKNVCGACARLPQCSPKCASDQICKREDAGTSCVHVSGPGEPCTGDEGFLCTHAICSVAFTGSDAGVCLPLAQVGDKCGDGVAAPLCEGADTFCDDTMHCRSAVPASYGQPCGTVDAGDYAECTAYGRCDYMSTGLCVSPAPDGALCDPTQGLTCLPPAECIAHHCLYPIPAYCTP